MDEAEITQGGALIPQPVITADLMSELQAAVRANLPARQRIKRGTSVPQLPFGAVYFGPLRPFAGGKDHYGMVRGMQGIVKKGIRDPMRFGPAIPFCPITSSKPSARPVLPLAPGTLPNKRGARGEYLSVRSYVLLYWRVLVTRRVLEADLHYVARLEEKLRKEAQRLLERS